MARGRSMNLRRKKKQVKPFQMPIPIPMPLPLTTSRPCRKNKKLRRPNWFDLRILDNQLLKWKRQLERLTLSKNPPPKALSSSVPKECSGTRRVDPNKKYRDIIRNLKIKIADYEVKSAKLSQSLISAANASKEKRLKRLRKVVASIAQAKTSANSHIPIRGVSTLHDDDGEELQMADQQRWNLCQVKLERCDRSLEFPIADTNDNDSLINSQIKEENEEMICDFCDVDAPPPPLDFQDEKPCDYSLEFPVTSHDDADFTASTMNSEIKEENEEMICDVDAPPPLDFQDEKPCDYSLEFPVTSHDDADFTASTMNLEIKEEIICGMDASPPLDFQDEKPCDYSLEFPVTSHDDADFTASTMNLEIKEEIICDMDAPPPLDFQDEKPCTSSSLLHQQPVSQATGMGIPEFKMEFYEDTSSILYPEVVLEEIEPYLLFPDVLISENEKGNPTQPKKKTDKNEKPEKDKNLLKKKEKTIKATGGISGYSVFYKQHEIKFRAKGLNCPSDFPKQINRLWFCLDNEGRNKYNLLADQQNSQLSSCS